MRKIYFDETLINTDYYGGLVKSAEVFNQTFKLGATICETYKFTVDKSQIANKEPSVVYLYNDDILEKTLFVDDYKEDDFTITYELTDSMVNFNFGYDASPIASGDGTTLLGILRDICSKANITTDIASFDFDDMIITWYDNSITARDYLSFIGEINASYLYITADNKLAMKSVNSPAVTNYNFDEIGKYKIGQKHKFSRVVLNNGVNFFEVGDATGDTYYINVSNVYVTGQDVVDNIYNKIKDYEFYDVEIDNLPGYSGKNLLPSDYSKFTKTQYGSIKLIENDELLKITIFEKDSSVDKSGLYLGFSIDDHYLGNANKTSWVIANGSVRNGGTTTNFVSGTYLKYVSIYPNTEENFNKLFSRYNIIVEKGAPDETVYEPYNLMAGDNITITDENNNVYNTIMRYDNLNLSGNNWIGGLKNQIDTSKQEETEYINTKESIRRLKITIDRDANQIKQEIKETNSLTKEELNGKLDKMNEDLTADINAKLDVSSFSSYTTSLETTLTSTEGRIEKIEKWDKEGISKVKTTSGTFNENGLTMEQTGAKTKGIFNQDGIDVQDAQGSSNEDLLFAGYVTSQRATSNTDLKNYEGQTVVYTRNNIVKNYLVIGKYSRMEDYEDGTGIFYIGG